MSGSSRPLFALSVCSSGCYQSNTGGSARERGEGGREGERGGLFISLPFTQHVSTCHQLYYTCFSVFSQLNVFFSINANNILLFIIKLGAISVCLLLFQLFPCKLLLMYGFHTFEHRFTSSLFSLSLSLALSSLLCSSFDSTVAFPAFYLRTFQENELAAAVTRLWPRIHFCGSSVSECHL